MPGMPLRAVKARLAVLVVLGAALCAAPATASALVFPESPLLGYWPMYEGSGQLIHDISGANNTGVLGMTTKPDWRDAEWVTGLLGVGKALRLDGNDYVAIPETAKLRPQRVTAEAWVRAPKSPGRWKYVITKGGNGCKAGSFGLYSSANGGMAFYVYDGQRWYRSPQVTTAIWDNQWHHVAGTYDGERVRLFVDGAQIGAGTAYSGPIAYDLPVRQAYIGAYRGSCDLTMTGDIDEVRLWSVALRVDQIWGRIRQFLGQQPAAPQLPEEAGVWASAGQ
jgi:hypothetical protein